MNETLTSDWRHQAACKDEDPELFFPLGEGGNPKSVLKAQFNQAKKVCRRCPVAAACLTWALDNADYGVWGGLDPDERRALKQREAAA